MFDARQPDVGPVADLQSFEDWTGLRLQALSPVAEPVLPLKHLCALWDQPVREHEVGKAVRVEHDRVADVLAVVFARRRWRLRTRQHLPVHPRVVRHVDQNNAFAELESHRCRPSAGSAAPQEVLRDPNVLRPSWLLLVCRSWRRVVVRELRCGSESPLQRPRCCGRGGVGQGHPDVGWGCGPLRATGP